jgi:hypothetical protein
MRKLLRLLMICGVVSGFSGYSASAQDDEAVVVGQPRVLAPGVLRVVAPDLRVEEAVSSQEPLYDLQLSPFQPQTRPLSDTGAVRAANVVMRRDVWNVEFAYLPLRTMEADVPQASGKMQRKVIWYMVYRVRFDGQVMSSQEITDALGLTTYKPSVIPVDKSSIDEIRLFPTFALQAAVVDPATGEVTTKEYLDRVMPTVVGQVRQFEDPAQALVNTVEISAEPLYRRGDSEFGVDREVWGVATWEDVDPRTDYVSVQVQGLTSAFDVKQGAEGKLFKFKTLQLNFYRPGDEFDETRDRIRTGIPLVDSVDEQREILEFYQLPGPQLSVSQYDANLNVGIPLTRVNTQQDQALDTLEVADLDAGTVPDSIGESLVSLGYDLTGASATTSIPGNRWIISASRVGESVELEVVLAPRFWKKQGNHFEFNERLDAFWMYR